MKTKKCPFGKPFLSKRFVGIAIVLSLLFLVVLPTIAAEDDFVLGIYGNANEDDTIDMRDLTYVKLIFFGERQETDLADAKYDGEINPLDFVQIKLIIVGKEKELTVICNSPYGKEITIHKPIKRIVCLNGYAVETIRALKAEDKIVGISTHLATRKVFFPELSKLPTAGKAYTPDYEAIINLKPDIVIIYAKMVKELEEKLQNTDIKVVRLDFYLGRIMTPDVRKLGYILDKKDKAEEIIDFYEGYMDIIKERIEKLSEDEKPRVYLEGSRDYMTFSKTLSGTYDTCVAAGGRNIAVDLPGITGPSLDVDPEWVMEQNPDTIIKSVSKPGGYERGDDPSEMKALRDNILNRPELSNVIAVKKEHVYVINYDVLFGPKFVVGVTYMAKWFHPDLFKDLDPPAIHQEYLDKFHKDLHFNVYEHGVFVYPPLEESYEHDCSREHRNKQ